MFRHLARHSSFCAHDRQLPVGSPRIRHLGRSVGQCFIQSIVLLSLESRVILHYHVIYMAYDTPSQRVGGHIRAMQSIGVPSTVGTLHECHIDSQVRPECEYNCNMLEVGIWNMSRLLMSIQESGGVSLPCIRRYFDLNQEGLMFHSL